MSFEAINWALKQPIKGGAKFVLVVLAHHANEENKCWPGLELIADECGLSRATVITHITELNDLLLITKEKRFDERGYRRSNLYTLDLSYSLEIQRKNSLRRKNQRSNFEDQSQNNDISNVKNSDGNIIELSLEQTIEHTGLHKIEIPHRFTSKDCLETNIQNIFNHWQSVFNYHHAKFDEKRMRVIRKALKLGYSVEELKQAINGCAATPYNMGKNDNHQKYDDIELILRDASHIESFIKNYRNPPRTNKLNNTDIMLGVGYEQ